MFIIDFLFIIGFIVYAVLKAMGEANRKKQEHVGRSKQRPQTPVQTESYNPEPQPSKEYFPSQMPWEEALDLEERHEVEIEYVTPEGYSTEGYSTEGYSTEGYSTEGYSTEGYALYEGTSTVEEGTSKPFLKDYQQPQPAMNIQRLTPDYSLELTTEQIWQGIIWSEILRPPKCRKSSRS